MDAPKTEAAYLITWFRTFYNEVVRLKKAVQIGVPVTASRVLSGSVAAAVPAGEAPDEHDGLPEQGDTLHTVLAVHNRLLGVLERREHAAERIGSDYAFQIYKQAQYVMAALADEVFLNLDWKGRLLWKDYLLEARLFQSAAAGDRFFGGLDALLREGDAGKVELAKVYLMALVLDFRGRYRGIPDPAPLTAYRDDLYAFIARHDADLDRERPVLCRQAYAHTLVEGFAEMVPDPRSWGWVLVLVVVTLFMLSWIAWADLTGEVVATLRQISGLEKTVQVP